MTSEIISEVHQRQWSRGDFAGCLQKPAPCFVWECRLCALSLSQCSLFSCSLDPSLSSLTSPCVCNPNTLVSPEASFASGEQCCSCHCSGQQLLSVGSRCLLRDDPKFQHSDPCPAGVEPAGGSCLCLTCSSHLQW